MEDKVNLDLIEKVRRAPEEDFDKLLEEAFKVDLGEFRSGLVQSLRAAASDADWGIISFLRDLNVRGYESCWSCEGHVAEVGGWDSGFIEFNSSPITGTSRHWAVEEKSEVRKLAKRYGIKNLRFDTTTYDDLSSIPEDYSRRTAKFITFDALDLIEE